MTPSLRLTSSRGILAFWLLVLTTTFLATTPTKADESSLLDACRRDGFDPWQLSCETCDILKATVDNSIHNRCMECCSSYKTSKRITKPYEAAVLVHRESQASGSEMEQFLDEHWDDLVKLKDAKRLMKIAKDETSSSSYFMFRRPAPQMVLWFDSKATVDKLESLKYKELKELATEIVTLDGYRKDDIKDMISTLLPDK